MHLMLLFNPEFLLIHVHCVASSKWAMKEKTNEKAIPKTNCSSPLGSALFRYLKSSLLNAWSLSLAVRQANTGPGIRREGGGMTTKKTPCQECKREDRQGQPPDWHRRVLRPGTAVEPITSGGRVCFAPGFLAPTLSAHFLQLSSFLAGPHSKAREPGAGVEPG